MTVLLKMEILHLDIFKLPQYFNNYFDIVIEYTCFCAIDPKTRVNYIKMVKDILKPRGKFIGLLFPLDLNTNADGPPFHIDLNKTLLLIYAVVWLVFRKTRKNIWFRPLSK